MEDKPACWQLKQAVQEQAITLLYWLKWTVLAVTTGIVVGGGVAVFLTVLAWAIKECRQQVAVIKSLRAFINNRATYG
ncbi:MAG: hypothetical protein H6Q72_4090 [Firmicutes bacterium]|nr:hypothetical protein [Bacillota bacterium]